MIYFKGWWINALQLNLVSYLDLLEYLAYQKYSGLSVILEVIARTIRTRGLYCLVPNQVQSLVVETHQIPLWNPPPSGVIKVIVDANVISSLDHFGVGVVGRDGSGAILCGEGKFLPGSFTPLMAELIATQDDLYGLLAWDGITLLSSLTHHKLFKQ